MTELVVFCIIISALGTNPDTPDFETNDMPIDSIHHAESESEVGCLQSLTVFEKNDPIGYDFHVYSVTSPHCIPWYSIVIVVFSSSE